ncbi:hypothetical protein, partial [Rhodococcus rhodochrous]|uniref:hypothetical protein n=1 Tax=Rhodococcus rhodochrous TaxID=1829 RepID=UPI0012FD7CBB
MERGDQAVGDMRQRFVDSIEKFALHASELPNLLQAIDRSEEAIARARRILSADNELTEWGIDFVGFGSLARYEVTANSDLDYLLIGDV